MNTFEYRALDAQGRTARGLVEANSVKEARERLAADGILAERIVLTGRTIRFPRLARAMVYRELSALLGAGLPLVRALEILIASPEHRGTRGLLAGVRDRVREGSALADALAEASPAVTAFERSIIEAAERSADVERMLENLAGFLEEQERIRDRIQGALLYPSIVFTVGICVAILMLGLLLPRAQELLEGSRAPVPAVTAFTVGLGRVLLRAGGPVLLLLLAAGWMVRTRMQRDAAFRVACNQRLFRVPLAGRGLRLLVNLRFARTLAILLRGGVPLIEGLVLAGRATGSPWIAERAAAEAEAVRQGDRLSEAVRRIPPLAESLPGWIEVGEAGGGLDRLLDSAAHRFQDHWERFVTRALSVLEPVLILGIGAFVLLVTISVLLPIISLTQSVTK